MDGQHVDTRERPPRLTAARFAADVADELFSADRGLPWTMWQLTRRPGTVLRLYVDWRDARVTRPLRYYLFALSLSGLLLWASRASMQFTAGFREGFDAAGAAAGAPAFAGLLAFFAQPAVILALTFVPGLALAIERAYRSEDVNVAESFAMSFHLNAHASLLFSLALVAIDLTGIEHPALAVGLLLFVLAGYPMFALRGAFPARGWPRAGAAVWLALALTFLATLLLVFVRAALVR